MTLKKQMAEMTEIIHWTADLCTTLEKSHEVQHGLDV